MISVHSCRGRRSRAADRPWVSSPEAPHGTQQRRCPLAEDTRGHQRGSGRRDRSWTHSVSAAVAAAIMFVTVAFSPLTSATRGADRILHEGIAGRLVLCGGGRLSDAIRTEFTDGIPEDGMIVIIAAASSQPDQAAERAEAWLGQSTTAAIRAPDATPPDNAEHDGTDGSASAVRAVADAVAAADAVWFCGGSQSRIADRYGNTDVETELTALLARGGVIGGTSAGAAIMSRTMIASGRTTPRIAEGFDLLPGAIVDQHFTERNRIGRSRQAVARHPHLFGLGIDESTAVIAEGRRLRVIGEGAATVLLAPCSYRAATEFPIRDGQVSDLTQLRRAARHRARDVDPGLPVTEERRVAHGSLVIVGGGGMPREIVDRFIELAGGPEARIVCLPTAVPRAQALRSRVPGFLRRADIASVVNLPQSREDEVESEEFRNALAEATGIWFGGGRQWNFVDAYEGTSAVELFHDVLRRGGVIAGSSAGATIQGEFLVRGHPLGNTVMMAEGYERGFAFLPGTAIDQHFSQRNRLPDLLPVIERHPRLLGVGIDEATALVVQGSRAEVIGSHAVHFLTHSRLEAHRETESASDSDGTEWPYLSVASGDSVDLGTLQVTEAVSDAESDADTASHAAETLQKSR